MGIASIVCGVVAILFALIGALVSVIPGVGTVLSAILSLSAPVVALIGIVLGGVGMSRAREESGSSGSALAGLIVSIIAFFPAILVALSCGLCNSLCAAAMIDGAMNPRDSGTPFWMIDAGPPSYPSVDPTLPPPPGDLAPPPGDLAPPPGDLAPPPLPPGQPPPAFPPPPIPDEPPAPP